MLGRTPRLGLWRGFLPALFRLSQRWKFHSMGRSFLKRGTLSRRTANAARGLCDGQLLTGSTCQPVRAESVEGFAPGHGTMGARNLYRGSARGNGRFGTAWTSLSRGAEG